MCVLMHDLYTQVHTNSTCMHSLQSTRPIYAGHEYYNLQTTRPIYESHNLQTTQPIHESHNLQTTRPIHESHNLQTTGRFMNRVQVLEIYVKKIKMK